MMNLPHNTRRAILCQYVQIYPQTHSCIRATCPLQELAHPAAPGDEEAKEVGSRLHVYTLACIQRDRDQGVNQCPWHHCRAIALNAIVSTLIGRVCIDLKIDWNGPVELD